MNTDHISIHPGGGMSFVGPDAIKLMGVVQLRAGIALHRKCGMIPTRGATITRMLASATSITGKEYKGKLKHERAEADLTVWIEAAKASMPITHTN